MKITIKTLLIILFFAACTKESNPINDNRINSEESKVAPSQQAYSLIGRWCLVQTSDYCAQSCVYQSYIQWNSDSTVVEHNCCSHLKGGGCVDNDYCPQQKGTWELNGDKYTFIDKYTNIRTDENIVFTTDSTLNITTKGKVQFYFKKENS